MESEFVFCRAAETHEEKKVKDAEVSLSVGPMEWSDDEDEEEKEEDEVEGSGSESEKEGQSLTKQEKRKKEEIHIRGIEKRMRDDEAPETVEEFDRLLMQNPNSSFLWIKYMAFMLSRGEEEKARQVAEVREMPFEILLLILRISFFFFLSFFL